MMSDNGHVAPFDPRVEAKLRKAKTELAVRLNALEREIGELVRKAPQGGECWTQRAKKLVDLCRTESQLNLRFARARRELDCYVTQHLRGGLQV
jgi:hypothetical protein